MRDGAVPTRFKDVDAVRAAHGDELVDSLMASVRISDDLADEVVASFRTLPGGEGWRLLDALLAGGPEAAPQAPEELRELAATAWQPPDWVDPEVVEAGAVAWWRAGGLPNLLALTAGSLAYGYGTASLAHTLSLTGRLERMAPRRLGETARWALVATRPGALRPGGPGATATVRLRLVHALVRAHLRGRGDWDAFNLGEPLNAGDTMATGMLGFFVVPVRALEDLGVRWTPGELDAMTELWRHITWLMGAPEELLPASYAETEATAAAAMAIDNGPVPEGRALLDALLFHGLRFERVLPGPLQRPARLASGHALGALARRWMGDERADVLGAPDTVLKHLVPLARPAARARDLVRRSGLLGSEARMVQREFALMDRVLDAVGARPAALAPEHVEREPVLARRAAA